MDFLNTKEISQKQNINKYPIIYKRRLCALGHTHYLILKAIVPGTLVF